MKTTQERLQKCFEHLRYIGEVRTQNDLAKRIGVGKSNVSSAMNGNTAYLTDNFLMRFCQAFPIFDLRWLTTGEGDMLRSAPTENADLVALNKALDALSASQSHLTTSQKQIDRLLALLERK